MILKDMTFINYAVGEADVSNVDDQDYPCTKVSDNDYGVHDVFFTWWWRHININHYASINATAGKKVTLKNVRNVVGAASTNIRIT